MNLLIGIVCVCVYGVYVYIIYIYVVVYLWALEVIRPTALLCHLLNWN